jgi:prevent-host-death family protein
MDELWPKLSHYVRHAQAGNEVLITRWGKPVARLVPHQTLLDTGSEKDD